MSELQEYQDQQSASLLAADNGDQQGQNQGENENENESQNVVNNEEEEYNPAPMRRRRRTQVSQEEEEQEEQVNQEGEENEEFPDFEDEVQSEGEEFPDFEEEEEEEEMPEEEEEEEVVPVTRGRGRAAAAKPARSTVTSTVTSTARPVIPPPSTSASRPLGTTGPTAQGARDGTLTSIPRNRLINTSQLTQGRQVPAQPSTSVPSTAVRTNVVGTNVVGTNVRAVPSTSVRTPPPVPFQPVSPVPPPAGNEGGLAQVNVGAGFRTVSYESLDPTQLPESSLNSVIPELSFLNKKLTARQEVTLARKTLREQSTGAHTYYNPNEGQKEVLKQPGRPSVVGGTLPAQFAPATVTATTTRGGSVPNASSSSSTTVNVTPSRRSGVPQHTYTTPAAPRRTTAQLQSDVTQLSGPAATAQQLQNRYQRVVNSATKTNVLANMKVNQQNLGSRYSPAAEAELETTEQQSAQQSTVQQTGRVTRGQAPPAPPATQPPRRRYNVASQQ
jgi:hypothetical protein